MKFKLSSLVYLLLICVLIAPVFSPAVYAKVLYGPETFEKTGSDPVSFRSYADIANGAGFIAISNGAMPGKLYIKRNSGDGSSQNMSVMFNGQEIAVDQDLLDSLISRDVLAQGNNSLEFLINNSHQYSYTMWLENDSPGIEILTPTTDTSSSGTIFLSGYVQDLNLTNSNKQSE